MSILTEKEIKEAWNMDESLSFIGNELKDARAIESAVLSKLAEQTGEPTYWLCEGELYKYEVKEPSSLFSVYVPIPGQEKLYTETQLIAAQQRTAEACAKLCQREGLGAKYQGDVYADAVRNGEWREYL